MKENEIKKLLSESGSICLSMITPVDSLSPERQMNEPVLQNELELLKEVARKKGLPDDKSESLILKAKDLIAATDLNFCKKGLGIFVSDHITAVVHFPFPVTPKLTIEDHFDKRDLLFYLDFISPAYLVSAGKKEVRLFSVSQEEFTEINNEDFPIHYEEFYEYSRPDRANSFSSGTLKNFEKDKSELQEIRITDLLRKADHLLGKYTGPAAPVIISGNKKEVHDFLEITDHPKQIAGKIYGSYHYNGHTQLAAMTKQELLRIRSGNIQRLILDLKELVGKKLVASGIASVWESAASGNCSLLILEKDFECHGSVHRETGELKMHNPAGKSEYSFTGNLVERVIEKVLQKGGKVIFAENGQLEDFDHIALQLRYPA